nr:MAG TPA: hypothetical protein [Herelleviridae sp.]
MRKEDRKYDSLSLHQEGYVSPVPAGNAPYYYESSL